jgi:hypothetical protein
MNTTTDPGKPSPQAAIALYLQEAAEATESALLAADHDDDPGLYHRVGAALEALRGILGDVERAWPAEEQG